MSNSSLRSTFVNALFYGIFDRDVFVPFDRAFLTFKPKLNGHSIKIRGRWIIK